ncbi:hypothetical protein [Methanosarcina horonobensis]|uniref:hypothetical protein n=1 Tax=Methanosarcina horonobensis TaxID=418008 RepID=UPI000A515143|nr:hypothetical protein [Methanosarcina horonobensis]
MYAASLGVAKQAFQNMSLIVPFEQFKESCFLPISHYYNQSNNQSGYGHGNTCSSSCSDKGENGEDKKTGSGSEDRSRGAE